MKGLRPVDQRRHEELADSGDGAQLAHRLRQGEHVGEGGVQGGDDAAGGGRQAGERDGEGVRPGHVGYEEEGKATCDTSIRSNLNMLILK